ncbi:3-isopropylmalate dehydratase large subunit [Oenococcus alcoholitolerans]|uniref:3-isopropylmalate dehydratase large subunit n=1 Tax=Oenococcus alcoholitolerans TaxID=931074 RepID=UPI003F6E7644
MGKTLFDKIWQKHVVAGEDGQVQLLYVDLHLVHEVTSPQPFESLRENHRTVRRPDLTFATMDHNVPTKNIFDIKDKMSKLQMKTLEKNARDFNIRLAPIGDIDQGIVHVIGPQLGLTQPGEVIVCGDSHTATHGAFGSIAFGIGTSEVEHVLSTQTIWQLKPKTMGIKVVGKLPKNLFAKDIIMAIIAKYGVSFGTGYAIEFFGPVIENLSMEERMTICNMSIEAGSKTGLVRPDEKTFAYIKGRKYAPKKIEEAVKYWSNFYTDNEDDFDKKIIFDVSGLKPIVTWGTNPGMAVKINEKFPEIRNKNDQRAYEYMDLKPDMLASDIPLSYIFIGSCTNGRYEDLKVAAEIMKGRHLAKNITAWIVPGSRSIRNRAIKSGLAKIFEDAGCQWREPGCSACLAMNPDKIPAGKHAASTSNRNFEGRQGAGSRTHLASPAMVAAAGIAGHFVDITKENFLNDKAEVE